MPDKAKAKKKSPSTAKATARGNGKAKSQAAKKPAVASKANGSRGSRPATPRPAEVPVKEPVRIKPMAPARKEFLSHMLWAKRHEIMREIVGVLEQRLTEDQQRRLESAMDVGDQALMDLERELGISLMEMRNRKRQLIDEALTRVAEGTYGVCADCGVEINAKRLEAVPFAKLCVECQTRQELLEKIEKEEERD